MLSAYNNPATRIVLLAIDIIWTTALAAIGIFSIVFFTMETIALFKRSKDKVRC